MQFSSVGRSALRRFQGREVERDDRRFAETSVRHCSCPNHNHASPREVRRLHPAVRARRTVGAHRETAHPTVSYSFSLTPG